MRSFLVRAWDSLALEFALHQPVYLEQSSHYFLVYGNEADSIWYLAVRLGRKCKRESEERGRTQAGKWVSGCFGKSGRAWVVTYLPGAVDEMAPCHPSAAIASVTFLGAFGKDGKDGKEGILSAHGRDQNPDKAGNGAKRTGQNCQAHFTEAEFGVTVGSCGPLGEKRGKEEGRRPVINIC